MSLFNAFSLTVLYNVWAGDGIEERIPEPRLAGAFSCGQGRGDRPGWMIDVVGSSEALRKHFLSASNSTSPLAFVTGVAGETSCLPSGALSVSHSPPASSSPPPATASEHRRRSCPAPLPHLTTTTHTQGYPESSWATTSYLPLCAGMKMTCAA